MAEEKAKKTQLENVNEHALNVTPDLPTSDDNLNILQTILNDHSQNVNQNNQESD